MSKHGRGQVALRRRERGTAVPLVTRTVKLADGTTVTEHGLDLGGIDVPDRVYEADAAGAVYEKGMVKLMFAQVKLGGGLRSLVIVSITPQAALQFIRLVDGLKAPTLKEIADTVNVVPEPLMEKPNMEPEQTASLRASIIAAAFSGAEACFDFYLASAFSLAEVKHTDKLHLEPVVRIHTFTSLTMSLMDALRGFRKDFPEKVRKLDEDDHG